jgi:hypothetical protein
MKQAPHPGPAGAGLSRVLVGGLLLMLMLACSGCSSSRGGAKQFASVTIHGKSAATIRDTVAAVLGAQGYVPAAKEVGWAYERRGSTMSQVVHGGWFDTEAVRERIKLYLVPQADGAHRLDCSAMMVSDPGDAFFEEESRMTTLRSGPYQKLLNEVERRLR